MIQLNDYPIDPSIQGFIEILNNSGYATLYSCSGTFSDHYPLIVSKKRKNRLAVPYLTFDGSLSPAQQNKIIRVCDSLGIMTYYNEKYPNRLVLKFFQFERLFEVEVIESCYMTPYHENRDRELLTVWQKLVNGICGC